MGRAAKGRSIANLLEMRSDEKVAALIRIISQTNEEKEDVTWKQDGYLFFATKQGTVKKTAVADFANVRRGGIIAIKIDEMDRLIDVKLSSGENEMVLITQEGKSIRFLESNVRSMGRSAAGVRGIKLSAKDEVVALSVMDPESTLLVAGERGIGKRTKFDEYRVQTRGGKGIITMKTTDKTGQVVGALTVHEDEEIMLITVGSQMVRTPVRDIRETGRNTQGVKLIDLDDGDKLQAIAPVITESAEESAEAEAEGDEGSEGPQASQGELGESAPETPSETEPENPPEA
jgi:DNA gyrase subunit A